MRKPSLKIFYFWRLVSARDGRVSNFANPNSRNSSWIPGGISVEIYVRTTGEKTIWTCCKIFKTIPGETDEPISDGLANSWRFTKPSLRSGTSGETYRLISGGITTLEMNLGILSESFKKFLKKAPDKNFGGTLGNGILRNSGESSKGIYEGAPEGIFRWTPGGIPG